MFMKRNRKKFKKKKGSTDNGKEEPLLTERKINTIQNIQLCSRRTVAYIPNLQNSIHHKSKIAGINNDIL